MTVNDNNDVSECDVQDKDKEIQVIIEGIINYCYEVYHWYYRSQ